MDPEELERNLVAQQDRVRQVRERLAHLREARDRDEDVRELESVPVLDAHAYEDVSRANRRYLASRGRLHVALEDQLDADQLRLLDQESARLRWDRSDYLTVGTCALLGCIAALFEGAVDQAVVEAVGLMENSELIETWKAETENLPIDYQGQGAGGPAHRVTSAGHDPGRPLAAIKQIMEGQYEGTAWSAAGKTHPTAYAIPQGSPFDAVPNVSEAAALWVKHLVTDVITVTSLPLPQWTKLYEVAPTAEVARFAKDMYWSNNTAGWNVRTFGVTKMVPLVITEVGVRSKLAWDNYCDRGELRLLQREERKRDEMLLAANSMVAMFSSGHVVVECLTTSSPLGLRGLNPHVIIRAAHLGVRAAKAHREHVGTGFPSWEEMARPTLSREDDRLGPYAV